MLSRFIVVRSYRNRVFAVRRSPCRESHGAKPSRAADWATTIGREKTKRVQRNGHPPLSCARTQHPPTRPGRSVRSRKPHDSNYFDSPDAGAHTPRGRVLSFAFFPCAPAAHSPHPGRSPRPTSADFIIAPAFRSVCRGAQVIINGTTVRGCRRGAPAASTSANEMFTTIRRTTVAVVYYTTAW